MADDGFCWRTPMPYFVLRYDFILVPYRTEGVRPECPRTWVNAYLQTLILSAGFCNAMRQLATSNGLWAASTIAASRANQPGV
jgi:hypothetical protein